MPSFPTTTDKEYQDDETSHIKLLNLVDDGRERCSFVKLDPSGFFIRHPPKPHQLHTFITRDDDLFQTIHMGAAVIDIPQWRLSITGLVKRPFSLDLPTLKSFPSHTITSFHECFGSPLKPATSALWRIGNVRWTGVRLNTLLRLADPLYPEASYIWSEGLDRGEFAGVKADRYQKDLPLSKAMRDEVMLVYAINGQPLSKERGGPVRLIVPGWFGTNSTKWVCRIEVQNRRANGAFVTKFYNVPDEKGVMRPVWRVQVNSMITRPGPGERVPGGKGVVVEGWAWDADGVEKVGVSVDGGVSWVPAVVEGRVDFSWQRFSASLMLGDGSYTIIARATAVDGRTQPLSGHRNHCHSVQIEVGKG